MKVMHKVEYQKYRGGCEYESIFEQTIGELREAHKKVLDRVSKRKSDRKGICVFIEITSYPKLQRRRI